MKLVVSDTGDTQYRSKIIARMLEVAHRTDIPVGVGIRQATHGGPGRMGGQYDLARYPGKVFQDGVDAIMRPSWNARAGQADLHRRLPNIKAALSGARRSPGGSYSWECTGAFGWVTAASRNPIPRPTS